MGIDIQQTIVLAKKEGASDIHITTGLPVRIRVNGSLKEFGDIPVTEENMQEIVKELAGKKYPYISDIGELDLATTVGDVRTRINIYRQQGQFAAAIRILHSRIPNMKELGLPPVLSTFSDWHSGLVLITGETGSGKSTTLATLIDAINHTRYAHIITLEDPVEYTHQSDKCMISQREIERDTRSFETGLRAILREDPDVILIGEMRDLETIKTALIASETGHLVFATLHTNSAADTVDRIVSVFPADHQPQIRSQLSNCLRAVVCQQLLPKKVGNGRVLAAEVMVVNEAIRNLIREGRTAQMDSFITLNSQNGSCTLDTNLYQLYKDGRISYETAKSYSRDRARFEKMR